MRFKILSAALLLILAISCGTNIYAESDTQAEITDAVSEEDDEEVEIEGYYLENSSSDLSKADTGTEITPLHIVGIVITAAASIGIATAAFVKSK